MSGNPTGSNVVPMPHAPAPAQAPMPFPMWGGGGSLPWGPGCCPPGGMDALMKCYCDVQAATAFICSVMVTCIQTNPAVTAAIIAAIEASGSSIPLIGVTNGSDAQPGQVGQWIQMQASIAYPASTPTTVQLSLGSLPAGDWTVMALGQTSGPQTSMSITLNPEPEGLSYPLTAGVNAVSEWDTVVTPMSRILTAVPVLIAFSVLTAGSTAAGSTAVTFFARRAR